MELEEFWKNLLQVVVRYGDRRGRPLEATAAKLATAITKNENAALSHAAQTAAGIPLAQGENPSGGFDAQGS